jgi:hypothetical protein
MGPRFLPLITPHIGISQPQVSQLIKSYEKGKQIPESMQLGELNSGKDSPRGPTNWTSGVFTRLETCHFQEPSDKWDEADWGAWWDNFISRLLLHSESRAISVCKDIAGRLALIKNLLFPISFALTYSGTNDATDLKDIFSTVFWARHCPGYIVRGFLEVFDIFEVVRILYPNDNKVVAKHAIGVDYFAQALRLYEGVLQEKRSYETIEILVSLNQKLGLPLAAQGIQQFCQASQAKLFEKLGLWEDALTAYGEQKNVDGVMTCLRALSRFTEMKGLSEGGCFMASV